MLIKLSTYNMFVQSHVQRVLHEKKLKYFFSFLLERVVEEDILAPPKDMLGGLVADHALVARRPAGLGPGQRRQGPARRDEGPFLVLDRLLV